MARIQAVEIDPVTGVFVADVPHWDTETPLPNNIITTLPPAGFELARWDGAQWVEGADEASRIAGLRSRKKLGVRLEGLARMQAEYPIIQSFEHVQLYRDIILSIAPAARTIQPGIQVLSDIYQAGRDAIDAIDALATLAELQAYDVVNDPAWP